MAVVKERSLPREEGAFEELAYLAPPEAVARVKAGLNTNLVRQLATRLDLRLEDLAMPLHLTSRTLHRRLEQGRLEMDESERLLALIRIFALAKKVLGSDAKAVRWFKSPLPVLAGKSPLDCADTQIGLREIEEVLIRIQDVVYS